MRRIVRRLPGRALALVLAARLGPLACVPPELLAPRQGLREYQTPGVIVVPGGFVDAAGGNLLLLRSDLSLDTPLGPQALTAIYDAAAGGWRWSHQTTWDGRVFVDPSGARFEVAVEDYGAPIEGTVWEVVDVRTVQTKGGLAHHFAPDGSLDHIRWASLEYPRITFRNDGIAQCTAAAACAPLFALSHDGDGRLSGITDARTGRTALFEYDGEGRLVRARRPGDVESGRSGIRYEYGRAGLLVAQTSSEGERVEYAYGPGRRIAAVTRIGEGNPRDAFYYVGRRTDGHYATIHAGPLGGWTRYAFDSRYRLLAVERLGTSERLEIEWSGLRPSQERRSNGSRLDLVYADDRLVSYSEPTGNVVSLEYQPGGLNLEHPTRPPLRRREDSLGLIEERTYDSLGRVVSVRGGDLEVASRTYSAGSVRSLSGLGVTLDFPILGIHGRWLEAEIAGESVARRAVDPVGNVVLPHGARRHGGVLSLGYDADRRLVSLALASSDETGRVTGSQVVRVERRSNGRIDSILRPGGAHHEFGRDALGRSVRVRERVDGSWRTTAYEYDAADHPTVKERENGMREEYEYDAFGRMVRHRALRNGVLEGEAIYTWQGGRLLAYEDSIRGLAEIHTYDAAGRRVASVFGYGESIAYEYDLRGRLVAETFRVPGIGVVADLAYSYDGAGRLLRLTDRVTGVILVEDVVSGGLRRSTHTANGLVRSYAYDDRARLVGMETRDALGEVVETTAVTRSALAGPPRLEIVTTTETPLAVSEERYVLSLGDGLAHLDQRAGRRLMSWSDGEGGQRAFAWTASSDPDDTAAGDTFVYNAEGNRLLAVLPPSGASIDYAWDESGFAIRRGGLDLGWTATGRLASYGDDTLVWDMRGRLVEVVRDGERREFRLFGGRAEGGLAGLGTLDLGAVSIHLGSGEHRYRHTDFRGNVSFVSDDAGEVVAQHRYAPYGLDASWGPDIAGLGFERRSELGPLVLMGARVLDSRIGRFLSPDPRLQLVNQYAYTLGNPVGFEDRDGLEMAPREALQIGMDLVTVVTGTFFFWAVVTGAAPVAVTAAGTAYMVTHGVVTMALLVDAALAGPEGTDAVAPSAAPGSAPQPSGPLPDPGDAGPPAPDPGPGVDIRVLEAGPVPTCTPLAPVLPLGRSPAVGIALLLLNLALALGWWRLRREPTS